MGMKIKTSVTLEADILTRIDSVLSTQETRSAFFQDAVLRLAEKREREKRDARDLEILNLKAAELNDEALENLSFIADIFAEQGFEQP